MGVTNLLNPPNPKLFTCDVRIAAVRKANGVVLMEEVDALATCDEEKGLR